MKYGFVFNNRDTDRHPHRTKKISRFFRDAKEVLVRPAASRVWVVSTPRCWMPVAFRASHSFTSSWPSKTDVAESIN